MLSIMTRMSSSSQTETRQRENATVNDGTSQFNCWCLTAVGNHPLIPQDKETL